MAEAAPLVYILGLLKGNDLLDSLSACDNKRRSLRVRYLEEVPTPRVCLLIGVPVSIDLLLSNVIH